MQYRSLAVALLLSCLVAGCGGAAAEPLVPDAHDPSSPSAPSGATPVTPAPPATAPATAPAPATATAPAPATSGTDLSTPEKAKAAIYSALKAGDKDTFKKCVSKQNLAKHEKSFDGWFDVWKAAAERGPKAFENVRLAQEDGAWKLDEN